MLIRAKLKDVILLPDSDYELGEIKRITEIVKEDPQADIRIKFDHRGKILESIITSGDIKTKW